MRNISFAPLVLVSVVVAFVAGCTTARIGSDLSSSDPDYPVENSSPTRIIDIHGMLPSSLDVKLTANYGATKREGCEYTPTFIAGAVEGVFFPICLGVPLTISRDGERFSARLIVDRFKPGRCGWEFLGVSAQVSKGETVSLANLIVRNLRGRISDNNESWVANSQHTPVVWRCRFSRLADLRKGTLAFACGEDARKNRDKHRHLLNAESKTVEVKFIDLESQ